MNAIHGMGLKFGIFGGFGWVRCRSILVEDPGFGRVWCLVFPDLGLGSAHFWLNRFEIQAYWRGWKGFIGQFWWTTKWRTGSSEFCQVQSSSKLVICGFDPDMFLPKVQIVLFWRATRSGFAKNFSKTPKLSQIVKFWWFLAKNCSKTPKNWKLCISVLPDVDFTKNAKYSLFNCYIWRFWAIFGKTTSGSSPKQDILDLWQKHVWFDH